MKLAVVIGTLLVVGVVAAQDEPAMRPIRDAYRQHPTADRMVVHVPRGNAPPAKSELVVAVRPGERPAVALFLGGGDPLRVLAEPGRLLAWRQSDPARVFAAVLPEPFGRTAIESVLPPLLVPQLDLVFAAESEGLLAIMPPLSWTRVASGENDRFAGVAFGAALELNVADDYRLVAMEAKRGGTVLARAVIESVDVDEAWFEPPALDGTIVESLAELGREPGPARAGQPFGHAIGIDARGRATTLRAVALGAEADAERLVVLMVDARMPEDRSRLAGALAEAELADIAVNLGTVVVVLAVGDDSAASLFARVTRASTSGGQRVRTLAVDAMPTWAPASDEGIAFSVDGNSWVLVSAHMVPVAEGTSEQVVGPFEVSEAPRSLAERIAEAVGAAARK